jgi:hypothetical protein
MSKFETYATDFVRNVPTENLKEIIELTMKKCSLNMGSNYTDEMLQRTVELIKEDYSYMTVNLVVSALFRGSMGHFGAGRLIPKTIAQWLREISQEYQKEKDHREIEERFKVTSVPVDLKKYPMGKAICKKIDWLTSGAITSDEWDQINLKTVAEIIGAGHEPSLEYFGITKKE